MKKSLVFLALSLAVGLSFASPPASFGGFVNSMSSSMGLAASGAGSIGNGMAIAGSQTQTGNESGGSAWVVPGHNAVDAGTQTYNNSGSLSSAFSMNYGNALGISSAGSLSTGGADAGAFGSFSGHGHHH